MMFSSRSRLSVAALLAAASSLVACGSGAGADIGTSSDEITRTAITDLTAVVSYDSNGALLLAGKCPDGVSGRVFFGLITADGTWDPIYTAATVTCNGAPSAATFYLPTSVTHAPIPASGTVRVATTVVNGVFHTSHNATYVLPGSTASTPPATTPDPTPAPPSTDPSGCIDAANAVSAIDAAAENATLEFCPSTVLTNKTVSLDSVASHVTIRNLNLDGGSLVMTSRTTTTYLTLDEVSVTSGTNDRTLSSCYTGGATADIASVVLLGSHNTLTRSTISGGTASGVYLGGHYNHVTYTTFSNVNTFNGEDASGAHMTDCSGALVTGYYATLEFNSFDGCNGSCIHAEPAQQALIWGNSVNRALLDSFAGSIYHGDGGAIYTGWIDGHETIVAYNTITNVTQLDLSTAYQGGLYFDNYTQNFTAHHNSVDDVTSKGGAGALKVNPNLYDKNGNLTGQSTTGTDSKNRDIHDNHIHGEVLCTMSGHTSVDCPSAATNNDSVVVNWVSGVNPSGVGIMSPPSID